MESLFSLRGKYAGCTVILKRSNGITVTSLIMSYSVYLWPGNSLWIYAEKKRLKLKRFVSSLASPGGVILDNGPATDLKRRWWLKQKDFRMYNIWRWVTEVTVITGWSPNKNSSTVVVNLREVIDEYKTDSNTVCRWNGYIPLVKKRHTRLT